MSTVIRIDAGRASFRHRVDSKKEKPTCHKMSPNRRAQIVNAFNIGRTIRWIAQEYGGFGVNRSDVEEIIRTRLDELEGQKNSLLSDLSEANRRVLEVHVMPRAWADRKAA